MSIFAVKYGPDVRAAVLELVDKGLSGSEVAAELARGWADLAPVAGMPRDTVLRIAREERRRRQSREASPVATLAESDVRAALRVLVGRLCTLADRELGRLEARPANRPPSTAELTAAGDVLERLERITRRVNPASGKGSAGTAGEEAPAAGAAGGLLERLAAEAGEPPSVGKSIPTAQT